MEKERINENTIRVMIDNSDLKDRGITVMELLGNHEKIESFFYNILSEVDTEHDFEDDDQVSFQILPNRNGLELFISRLDEENKISDILDKITNFSSKQPANIDNISDKRRQELRQSDKGNIVKSKVSSSDHKDGSQENFENTQVILALSDFENAIAIANSLKIENLVSDLYLYEGAYYLNLLVLDHSVSQEQLKNELAIALEFSRISHVTHEVLHEHGQLILKHEALEKIKSLFS